MTVSQAPRNQVTSLSTPELSGINENSPSLNDGSFYIGTERRFAINHNMSVSCFSVIISLPRQQIEVLWYADVRVTITVHIYVGTGRQG